MGENTVNNPGNQPLGPVLGHIPTKEEALQQAALDLAALVLPKRKQVSKELEIQKEQVHIQKMENRQEVVQIDAKVVQDKSFEMNKPTLTPPGPPASESSLAGQTGTTNPWLGSFTATIATIMAKAYKVMLQEKKQLGEQKFTAMVLTAQLAKDQGDLAMELGKQESDKHTALAITSLASAGIALGSGVASVGMSALAYRTSPKAPTAPGEEGTAATPGASQGSAKLTTAPTTARVVPDGPDMAPGSPPPANAADAATAVPTGSQPGGPNASRSQADAALDTTNQASGSTSQNRAGGDDASATLTENTTSSPTPSLADRDASGTLVEDGHASPSPSGAIDEGASLNPQTAPASNGAATTPSREAVPSGAVVESGGDAPPQTQGSASSAQAAPREAPQSSASSPTATPEEGALAPSTNRTAEPSPEGEGSPGAQLEEGVPTTAEQHSMDQRELAQGAEPRSQAELDNVSDFQQLPDAGGDLFQQPASTANTRIGERQAAAQQGSGANTGTTFGTAPSREGSGPGGPSGSGGPNAPKQPGGLEDGKGVTELTPQQRQEQYNTDMANHRQAVAAHQQDFQTYQHNIRAFQDTGAKGMEAATHCIEAKYAISMAEIRQQQQLKEGLAKQTATFLASTSELWKGSSDMLEAINRFISDLAAKTTSIFSQRG